MKACELCNHEATLYCASDSAFLCCNCDAKVHEANFLVARHVRQSLCCKCESLTGNFISGPRSRFLLHSLCQSCSSQEDDRLITSSSSSSDCISSTESSATTTKKKKKNIRSVLKTKQCQKISSSSSISDISGEFSDIPPAGVKKRETKFDSNSKAEGILVIWYKRMGLKLNGNSVVVVTMTCQALGLCLERFTVLPFRVCLAASFWFGLRMCGDKSMATWQNLKRLEEVSGVPSKLIVTAETRLARVMRVKDGKQDLEEGWAECSI